MQDKDQRKPHEHKSRTAIMNHSFTAWLPDAVLTPKIGEFVGSRPMQVLSVSYDGLQVRTGRKPRFWNKRRGFDAIVDLAFHRGARADELTRVEVSIRANRRMRQNLFQLHSAQLLRDIHQCLLARDLG